MNVAVAVLNIIVLGFIFYLLWRQEQSPMRKFFWPSLTLKLCAGIALGTVYSHYYKVGDTFNYFEDGVRLAELARTDVRSYLYFLWTSDETSEIWSALIYKQPRAMFLSKFTSLFCLLTNNNYWIISLYFSTLAFGGAWLLVKKIISVYKPSATAAIISFLFFPSAVFWSSGIIKESIAMGSLFFLSFIFLKLWQKERLRLADWLFTVISLWLLWNLKYYYLAIFLPIVCTTLIVRIISQRVTTDHLWGKIGIWLLVFIVPLFIVSILHPNFYPERFMQVVVSSYYEYQAISADEDLIHYNSLRPTLSSLLRNAPLALFSGLFRPLLTEINTALQFFIAVENLLLLILFISACTKLSKFINSTYRLILFSILIYTVLLCVFLALSTPNFGTLSRYRVGFLPYFVFLLTIENPLINKLMASKIFGNLVR